MPEIGLEEKEVFFEADIEVLDAFVLMDKIEHLEKKITEKIEQSKGVYVYRSQEHENEENELISWMRKQELLICYKRLIVHYNCYNEKEIVTPRNNESVFYLEFTDSIKSEFLKKFRVSILDIENTLRGSMLSYLENSNFYTRDPLFDQFDFIFTNGDRVLLETAIHGGFIFTIGGFL